MRNKANLRGATGGASALQKKIYGELHMQQASAKQSQFAGTAPDGCGTGESPAELSVKRIARNKPNLARSGGRDDPSFPHFDLLPIMRNKPNLRRVSSVEPQVRPVYTMFVTLLATGSKPNERAG